MQSKGFNPDRLKVIFVIERNMGSEELPEVSIVEDFLPDRILLKFYKEGNSGKEKFRYKKLLREVAKFNFGEKTMMSTPYYGTKKINEPKDEFIIDVHAWEQISPFNQFVDPLTDLPRKNLNTVTATISFTTSY